MWPDCPPCLLPEIEMLLITIIHCYSGQELTTRELSFLYSQLCVVDGTILQSTIKKWKQEVLSVLAPQLVANLTLHPLYQFHCDCLPLYPAATEDALAAIDAAYVDAKTIAKRCRIGCSAYTPMTSRRISERSFESIIEDASAGAFVIEVDQPVLFFPV